MAVKHFSGQSIQVMLMYTMLKDDQKHSYVDVVHC